MRRDDLQVSLHAAQQDVDEGVPQASDPEAIGVPAPTHGSVMGPLAEAEAFLGGTEEGQMEGPVEHESIREEWTDDAELSPIAGASSSSLGGLRARFEGHHAQVSGPLAPPYPGEANPKARG